MTRTWVRMKWREDGRRERRNHTALWEKCGRSFLLEFSTKQYLKLTINTSSVVLFLVAHAKKFRLEHLGLSLPSCSVCVLSRGWRWAPPTSRLFLELDGFPGLQAQHGWGRAGNHTGTEAQGEFWSDWLEWVWAVLAGGYQGTSQWYHTSGELEEMAAGWLVQRGHSYPYSVLSPSSGAVTYLIIFIILLLSTGWSFFPNSF